MRVSVQKLSMLSPVYANVILFSDSSDPMIVL